VSAKWFFGIAFVLVAAIVGVGFFASSNPDGLEFVAQSLGFSGSASESATSGSPVADYAVAGVENAWLATALAGLAGVALVLVLGMVLGLAVRRSRREPVEPS
jgi:hypothetical protein